MIVSVGEGVKIEKYRESSTLYKIHASVLTNRLREEVEEKELATELDRFRRGMGIMDKIYMY